MKLTTSARRPFANGTQHDETSVSKEVNPVADERQKSPDRGESTRPPLSLLMQGALTRGAVALGLVALLWLAVAWALGGTA